MKLIEIAKHFLSTGNKVSNTPDEICPNCWGRQEYGDKFYQAVENSNVDVNNPDKQKGWIQDYAETHLKGIKLQHHDHGITCEKCKLNYIEEQ